MPLIDKDPLHVTLTLRTYHVNMSLWKELLNYQLYSSVIMFVGLDHLKITIFSMLVQNAL